MTAKQNPKEMRTLLRAKARQSSHRPIWDIAQELADSIPAEELARMPHDGAINYKHYIYGLPKVEE